MNELSKELIKLSDSTNATVFLPVEIVNIIKHKKIESGWKEVKKSDVLKYMANMFEE